MIIKTHSSQKKLVPTEAPVKAAPVVPKMEPQPKKRKKKVEEEQVNIEKTLPVEEEISVEEFLKEN